MLGGFSTFGLVYFDILSSFKERRFGNLLLSFYVLYFLIRNGSTKKQMLCLLLLMIYQLFLEVWFDWQENSEEFELLESIGFNVGKSVFKWLAFIITIANSKIPTQSKNLKIFQFYLFGEKSKLQRIMSKYRKSIDINHDGNTEHISILGNHLKIVQLLLQTFKHTNVSGNEECMVCVYF